MNRVAAHAVGVLGALLLAAASMPALAAGTGYLFISSEKDDEVLVLDGKSHTVVTRIDTSARPRHLQFSPDRRLMYAVCGEGEAIDIIDVDSLEVVDTIADIPDPELLDLSPGGGTIYVSLEDDGALGILDLAAWREAVGDDAEERLSRRVLTGSGRVGDDDDEEDRARKA